MPIASNVERTTQGRGSSAPTQADFHSLPTAGPVVWSKVMAQGSKTPVVPKLSAEAQNKIKKITTLMVETQIKDMLPQIFASVTALLNPNPQ